MLPSLDGLWRLVARLFLRERVDAFLAKVEHGLDLFDVNWNRRIAGRHTAGITGLTFGILLFVVADASLIGEQVFSIFRAFHDQMITLDPPARRVYEKAVEDMDYKTGWSHLAAALQ